jgi:hypothetical protein
MLPVVDVKLKRRGVANTRSWLRQRAAAASSPPKDPAAYALCVASAVSAASRRTLWTTNCLRQAVWLEHLLCKAGIACEVRLGVRSGDGDELDAHAWVERDGHVLIGGVEKSASYLVLGKINTER